MNNSRIKTFEMDMPQLGVKGRRVWVYLPPGYRSSKRRYPVLYMHDGQNLFDPETSFCGEWGVDRIIDDLCRAKRTAGAIVVGIDNGGEDRWAEYSPWFNVPAGRNGKGRKYAEFVVNELKPLIDRRFRTLPDFEHTGVAGSSYGAIISFYMAFAYPEVFSKAGVFSPAFWSAGGGARRLAERARPRAGLRVYMDVGTDEGDHGDDYLADAGKMAGLLAEKKVGLNFVAEEGGRHNEQDWARRFPAAFLWLFEGV